MAVVHKHSQMLVVVAAVVLVMDGLIATALTF